MNSNNFLFATEFLYRKKDDILNDFNGNPITIDFTITNGRGIPDISGFIFGEIYDEYDTFIFSGENQDICHIFIPIATIRKNNNPRILDFFIRRELWRVKNKHAGTGRTMISYAFKSFFNYLFSKVDIKESQADAAALIEGKYSLDEYTEIFIPFYIQEIIKVAFDGGFGSRGYINRMTNILQKRKENTINIINNNKPYF